MKSSIRLLIMSMGAVAALTTVPLAVATASATASGPVAGTGLNASGQLGDGTTTNTNVPVGSLAGGVLAGKTITQVSAGGNHTCVVASGAVFCWGDGSLGQLGNGANASSSIPVAVDMSGVLAGKTVTKVSASVFHTCAIADGAAYCWGRNYWGTLGNGSNTDTNVPVAVNTAGLLNGKTVTQISAGTVHTCATAGDAAYCWGHNDWGQLGDDSTTDTNVPIAVNTGGALNGLTVTQVVAGNGHTCAVASGTAVCWGLNAYGQIGDGTTTASHVPVATNTAGVLNGLTVTQVTAANQSSCALANGAAYCWGYNGFGGLGDGTTSNSSLPIAVYDGGALSDTTVTQISATNVHTCVVASGSAFCWGRNSSGELGDGTNTDSTVPVAVDTTGAISGKTIYQVSAGEAFTMILGDGVTDAPPPPPPLPPTGSSSDIALLISAALVSIGAALATIGRARRHNAAAR